MLNLDIPHNPLIATGAIVISSLLKSDLNIADRFDSVCLLTFIGRLLRFEDFYETRILTDS